MSALRSAISRLAEDFASQVLAALRTASLADLSALSTRSSNSSPRARAAAPTRKAGGGGRRLASARAGARRTAADFDAITTAVVELLKKHPEGLRAEQIQSELRLSRKDLPRPMSHALAKNLVRKKGVKRATRYFVR